MSVDLIIFDCDGVLIDSEVLACRTDAACLAEIGITISADEIMERYVGISAPTMLADIESRSGTRLSVDFAANLQQRIAEAFETELTAIPGIEQVTFWHHGKGLCRIEQRPGAPASFVVDRGVIGPFPAKYLQRKPGGTRKTSAGPVPFLSTADAHRATSMPRD